MANGKIANSLCWCKNGPATHIFVQDLGAGADCTRSQVGVDAARKYLACRLVSRYAAPNGPEHDIKLIKSQSSAEQDYAGLFTILAATAQTSSKIRRTLPSENSEKSPDSVLKSAGEVVY